MIKNGMYGIYFLENQQDIMNIEQSIKEGDLENIENILNNYINSTAFMSYNYIILNNLVLNFDFIDNRIDNLSAALKSFYNDNFFIVENPLVLINVDENNIYYRDFELYIKNRLFELKTKEFQRLMMLGHLHDSAAAVDILFDNVKELQQIRQKALNQKPIDYYYIVLNDNYNIIFQRFDEASKGNNQLILQHFGDKRMHRCFKDFEKK